ncbi:autotransporter outer membrane beta-barrel domain-containing protein [Phycisphaera mikurensis]|uniref:Autotransporter-associated beta strand repeat protein n=1 Tax=Phycisphaera mikurensis (strain NBRC 102666 / KCTC 22515 / FYK2301M01) TaxID=1142394 RepID=I0IF06_PHYMF|nr:hypothetical protein [Phycisphaera mikurensis]MBB6441637.1 hypothetical protein [Phycisphaera mikurensis]BAM03844.1 hypothetical protein PSMK_16850 [Phycisphaera mikurensis NBRC 102666]
MPIDRRLLPLAAAFLQASFCIETAEAVTWTGWDDNSAAWNLNRNWGDQQYPRRAESSDLDQAAVFQAGIATERYQVDVNLAYTVDRVTFSGEAGEPGFDLRGDGRLGITDEIYLNHAARNRFYTRLDVVGGGAEDFGIWLSKPGVLGFERPVHSYDRGITIGFRRTAREPTLSGGAVFFNRNLIAPGQTVTVDLPETSRVHLRGSGNGFSELNIASGTVRLADNGRLSDGTRVRADGTFLVDEVDDRIASLSGTGVVDLAGSAAILTVGSHSNGATATTFSGDLGGSGTLVVDNAGYTLTLAGEDSRVGRLRVDAGELVVAGKLHSDLRTPVDAGAGMRVGGTLTSPEGVTLGTDATLGVSAGGLVDAAAGLSVAPDGSVEVGGTVRIGDGGSFILEEDASLEVQPGGRVEGGELLDLYDLAQVLVREGHLGVFAGGRVDVNPNASLTLIDSTADFGREVENFGQLLLVNAETTGDVLNDGGAILAAGVNDLGGGDLEQYNGGRLIVQFHDEPGAVLTTSGTATLAGGLELTASSPEAVPAPYERATVLAAGDLGGRFATVAQAPFEDGTALAVTYDAAGVHATRALIGDANLDGDVDVAEVFTGNGDAQILASNLGITGGAAWVDGDFSGDGDVDVAEVFTGTGDAQLLAGNLGATVGAASGAAASRSAGVFADAASAGVAAAAAAGTASGTYDPSTGEVVLSVGDGLGVVALGSRSGRLLDPGPVTPTPSQADDAVVAFFDAGGLRVGAYDLGPVVQPGTPASDLGLSFTPLGGTTTLTTLTVVPEPGAAGLLALATLVLRRRRVG